jgi:hypothetical protein
MKTLTFTRKVLAIIIMAFCCLSFTKMRAQTIQIDSTFTSDGEIFPFEPNDTIYGLSISGHVSLSSDTSLVRVILTDNSGNEWMVYEAYPFIHPHWKLDLNEVADETMYRQIINPYSLKIQIVNASLELEMAVKQNRYKEDLEILQDNFKNVVEDKKVDSLNYLIDLYQMLWRADRNPVSDLSFKDKEQVFGDNYNLMGLDFYCGGIYDAILGVVGPNDDSELVGSFDWRNRHGANDPSKSLYYYDGDPTGSGWMTKIEDQNEIYTCTGLCYIYAPLAAIEGVANLYFNNQIDYNLSEQHVLDCDSQHSDECLWGYTLNTNLYVKYNGVLDEECYPRDSDSNNCRQDQPPEGTPHYRIQIAGTKSVSNNDQDAIKDSLINYGPLVPQIQDYYQNNNHYMALVGYGTIKENDSFYVPSDPLHPIIVEHNSDYIGKLYWIFKNSWGKNIGELGYFYHLAEDIQFAQNLHYIPFIDDILHTTDLTIAYDKDQDGYWNWGISPEYDLPSGACSQEEDSDDSENRIGPFDSKYNGIPVKPEMIVAEGSLNTPITNHGFYFFDENNITLTFQITNPGSANLHLIEFGNSVTVSGPDMSHFTNIIQPDEASICMFEGNHSNFSLYFTTTETGRMHEAHLKIAIKPIDKDVLEDFEFGLIFNGCSVKGRDTLVTGYKPYNGYNLIPNDIYIDDGGIVEVFGSLAMYPESDIFIDAGGKLIVNGGLITGITGSDENCRSLWHGIDIWGNPQQTQSLTYQGFVSVINGGCIEYAEIGIETAHHQSPRTWYPSGGIIECSDAFFKDNLTDIKFYPYDNTHPLTHQLIPNISRFTNTVFETTEDLYKFNFGIPSAHIFMSQVGGIRYTACSFGNYSSFHTGSRGIGIESHGAGYFVTNGCAQGVVSPCPPISILPCRFENLDYGIRSFNNYGFYTINVGTAEFNHNFRGIYLNLVNNPTIIKNTFDISDPEEIWSSVPLIGLYLEEFTTGFTVEENTFSGPSSYNQNIGIHLLNIGIAQNEIYNNSFNELYQGVTAVGDNRNFDSGAGLCIKCNDFTNCNLDIYVTPKGGIITNNTGIALNQGLPNLSAPYYNTIAAGNTFSESQVFHNYFNDLGCRQISYTYHGTNNSNKRIIPEQYSGLIVVHPDPHATYSKESSCPSHLGGSITLSNEKSALISENSLIDLYQDTLLTLVDGGNTEGLNFEILTSFPEEALVIRQELMNESPFLSDTVMVSAIEKEDVLPGAIVRDILVVNPQSSKSLKIIDALEQRKDSIPGYMMEEIMQGLETYGAKELLEQEIGKHIAKKERAWTNLNLYYKNDTAEMSEARDSLITLHQNDKNLTTRYNLGYMYLDFNDSINAFNVLNNIPSEFDLSEQELSIHSQYQALFDLLWDKINDTISLDSIQIKTLFEMSSVSNSLPGIYASNLLIKEGLLDYNEPVYLYDPLKSSSTPDKKPKLEKSTDCLKLFPNPAGNYFMAEYNLSKEQYPGLISISDIYGKELKLLHLKDKQNQIVIPTQRFAEGIYIVQLYSGNDVIESKKITIAK